MYDMKVIFRNHTAFLFLPFLSLFMVFLLSCSLGPSEPTVCMVTDSRNMGDRGYNDLLWKGIVTYYENSPEWPSYSEGEKPYHLLTASGNRSLSEVLVEALGMDVDLIIATGPFFEVLKDVALDYPQQKFMVLDCVGEQNIPKNVINYIFNPREGSFLVGALTALQSKVEEIENPRFGFVGGLANANILEFENGFLQGLQEIIPDAELVDFFVGNFEDASKAQSKASEWYDEGIYAVYAAAGKAGLGVIQEAVQRRQRDENCWVLGVDADQFKEGLYDTGKSAVLTSMKKNVDNAIRHGLDSIKNKNFKGGSISFGLLEGGVDYTLTNRDIDREVVLQVEELKEDLLNSKRVVKPRN